MPAAASFHDAFQLFEINNYAPIFRVAGLA
jgi:hypothetical protein